MRLIPDAISGDYQATDEVQPLNASRSYGNFLPSAHLRYAQGGNGVVRASYSKGVDRPDFTYTAPLRALGEDPDSPVEEDNPNVKAAPAHNLDLSCEHYLRPLGLISAAVFYKQINDHRSKFIQSSDISNPALNVFWDGRSSVDFSATYGVTKQWKVYFEANNLTDTRQVRFQGDRNRVLELEGFGRSWLAGVKFEY